MVVFGQGCCIRANVAVVGQEWLYLGKSGYFRAKVVVFQQSGCIWAKVVLFGL